MDFEELNKGSAEANQRKNRLTLVALFAMFVVPVILAYLAFALKWFDGASVNHGELIASDNITHIEDYAIKNDKGDLIHGREFETLYWWILPLDESRCDAKCQQLNLHVLTQTYKGLGKENARIKMLVISNHSDYRPPIEVPVASALIDTSGMQPKEETRSGKNLPLKANYIYLVDPVGNIFMRYPLVDKEADEVKKSKDLRFDILHLFKYSRLG